MDFRAATQRHMRTAGRLALDYPIAATGLFTLVASAFFLAFPGVDLWVSGLFYGSGGDFPLRDSEVLRLLRGSTYPIVFAIVAWLVIQILLKLARPERLSYLAPNITAFLLSTLIVGPGLLVNVILKGYWGRPRPHEIDIFGGDAPYVPVWEISEYCDSNCSFVSGETSVAFWLIAVAVVVPAEFRRVAVAATAVYAVAVSFNRVLFGGHFISDVLLSAGLTLMIVALGYRLFMRPMAWLAGDRIETGLTRLGRLLSRGRTSR